MEVTRAGAKGSAGICMILPDPRPVEVGMLAAPLSLAGKGHLPTPCSWPSQGLSLGSACYSPQSSLGAPSVWDAASHNLSFPKHLYTITLS